MAGAVGGIPESASPPPRYITTEITTIPRTSSRLRRLGVAACAHQAGIILWYLDGDFDESLARLLEARRLYESLSAAQEVAEVDDDLEILFHARKEPRRRLAAATRAHLGTPRTKNSSRLKHAFRLRARARALNDLGRLEERERALAETDRAVARGVRMASVDHPLPPLRGARTGA
ncbi:MAG: hypothetical protein ACYC8U_07325 [Thermoleophilia bacterium]